MVWFSTCLNLLFDISVQSTHKSHASYWLPTNLNRFLVGFICQKIYFHIVFDLTFRLIKGLTFPLLSSGLKEIVWYSILNLHR